MNKTARFLSVAAVAAFAAFGAHADEADGSQFALKFDTNRTRAEVAAEAVVEARTHNMEPAGSCVPRLLKPCAPARSLRANSAPCSLADQLLGLD